MDYVKHIHQPITSYTKKESESVINQSISYNISEEFSVIPKNIFRLENNVCAVMEK